MAAASCGSGHAPVADPDNVGRSEDMAQLQGIMLAPSWSVMNVDRFPTLATAEA